MHFLDIFRAQNDRLVNVYLVGIQICLKRVIFICFSLFPFVSSFKQSQSNLREFLGFAKIEYGLCYLMK